MMGWDRDAPFITCGEWEDKFQPEMEKLEVEIAKLRGLAAEVIAAWAREDDSISDAIKMLNRALTNEQKP